VTAEAIAKLEKSGNKEKRPPRKKEWGLSGKFEWGKGTNQVESGGLCFRTTEDEQSLSSIAATEKP